VWDSWHRRGPLPAHPVVVSFDDGYRSVLANALPVLSRLRWPGVLNLEYQIMRESFGMTPPMVRRLIAAGWEVDSHTIHHPDLTTVSAAQLVEETAGARRAIQREFRVPARFFCYPSGRTSARVEAAVARAGYLAATTTQPGLAQPNPADRFVLDRVRVNGGQSAAGLLAQLRAAGA
jgi:peptidoglycan/xylan/chitin deacetylase (PgdA/CDA1 family)